MNIIDRGVILISLLIKSDQSAFIVCEHLTIGRYFTQCYCCLIIKYNNKVVTYTLMKLY